jgi:hypothetical protein
MKLIITNRRYWFSRYCNDRGIPLAQAKYVNDEYGLQGYDRTEEVIVTNGAEQLKNNVIQKAKERFDSVKEDYI